MRNIGEGGAEDVPLLAADVVASSEVSGATVARSITPGFSSRDELCRLRTLNTSCIARLSSSTFFLLYSACGVLVLPRASLISRICLKMLDIFWKTGLRLMDSPFQILDGHSDGFVEVVRALSSDCGFQYYEYVETVFGQVQKIIVVNLLALVLVGSPVRVHR